MIEIFTRKSWSSMGGDRGCDDPVSKGMHTPENALMYMRGLQRLWDRVENKTDMPKRYRDWKYTDRYSMAIYAMVDGSRIPLVAPYHWSEEERKEYAKARDIAHLCELHAKFEKNFLDRRQALEDEVIASYGRPREEYDHPPECA